jgi:UDP-N-acetylglucosamine 2-epimerase (non-hydrolysing)
MKVAPLLAEAKNHPNYVFTLLHTGQHSDYEMSKVFFDEMGIPSPDIYLGAQNGSGATRLKDMVRNIRLVVGRGIYQAVIVLGDVDSTLAGAIAAAGSVPLIHIEAGLRSFDLGMPEERNRMTIDALSDLLFTTEPAAVVNLGKEGVAVERIKPVGNLMIENLENFLPLLKRRKSVITKPRKYVVVTIHRAENTQNREILEKILKFLVKLSKEHNLIVPLHPAVKLKIASFGLGKYLKGIVTTKPLGYLDFMSLVMRSSGVVTDSGGIQEETTHLGVPCVTIRNNTERPITVTQGSNKLFPIENIDILEVTEHLKTKFKKGKVPMWDKEVSRRIFSELDGFFDSLASSSMV